MSTSPQKPADVPASSGMNPLRIILFIVLAYMVFALAYDYGYLFGAHEAKFLAVQKMVEQETSRSADDRETKGAISPADVAKEIGFASTGLEDHKHYFHEKYVFRRALPWLTRDIDVFYKGTKAKPELYSVAHDKEEAELVTPTAPIVPKEPEPIDEDDKKTTDDDKKSDKTDETTTDDKKTDEGDKKADTTEDKKTDETTEPAPEETKKTDEKPADDKPAEEKKDEAAPE